MRLVTALTLALTATAALAQRADPMQSSECAPAQVALAAEEQAVRRPHRPDDDEGLRRLLALRRQAASACLGEARASVPRTGARSIHRSPRDQGVIPLRALNQRGKSGASLMRNVRTGEPA